MWLRWHFGWWGQTWWCWWVQDYHLLRHNAISKLHAVISQKLMVVDGRNNRSYEMEGKDTEGYIWRVVCEQTQNENEVWHQQEKKFIYLFFFFVRWGTTQSQEKLELRQTSMVYIWTTTHLTMATLGYRPAQIMALTRLTLFALMLASSAFGSLLLRKFIS